MAYRHKTISNPASRQHIRFLQTAKDTGGHYLEMESFYEANSKEPLAHYHPYQFEDFTVQEGQLTVKLKGIIKILHAGDRLHIPPGIIHSMWNSSASKTIIHWRVYPAFDTEYLLETGAGLAAEGKIGKNGMPGILQVAVTANRFHKVFRVAKPPFLVQQIVFNCLAPVALLLGYRGAYKRHLD